MKKYLAIAEEHDTPSPYSPGDVWEKVFDTPEDAAAAAESMWNDYSPRAKKCVHVYSAVVTEDDLDDYAADEDTGEIDWRCFHSSTAYPGCFDSDKLPAAETEDEEDE